MLDINKTHNMDCLAGLKLMDDNSVNCCVTSPPYYGLRDYGVDGQIGMEETPEQYIEKLVNVFREVRRVLRDDGTLWVNIGDSYCGTGSKEYYKDPKYADGRNGQSVSVTQKIVGYKSKDLIGIPWMLAFALRADGWYLRQDIIWAKPNPMPESVTDRCTKSHEYIFLLSKSARYYFDADAIAEESVTGYRDREKNNGESAVDTKTRGHKGCCGNATSRYGGNKYTATPDAFNRTKSGNAYDYRPFRNKRDVWTVATQPFGEAHFATFPPKLIEPCILSGCPVGGVVLDPFMGSGTTAQVAISLQRNYVGFELNPAYIDIANNKRLDCVQIQIV